MTLHQEIANVAADRAAVYVGANTLSTLVLDSLKSSLAIVSGNAFPVTNAPFAAKLVSATTAAGNTPASIQGTLTQSPTDIQIVVQGGLVLEVQLGVIDAAGAFASPFTTIAMLVRDLAFDVDTDLGRITCSPETATFIPRITRDPNFDAIIAQLGLDPTEVARVEGVLAYDGIQTLVASSVSTPQEISLKQLFPGVTLHGALDVSVVSTVAPYPLTALLIIPGSILPDPESVCECAGAGDGLGPTAPGTVTPPAGGNNGSINIGGPTVPAAPNLGRRAQGFGDAGFYLPRSTADVITQGPYPAVRVDVGGGGFIKWKATGVVDFQKIGLGFDQNAGAIVIDLTCRIQISGKIQADFGKLGKITVASFSADQAAGANRIEIGLCVVVNNGVVSLKPVARVINIGPFDVDVNFGKIIGFGGAGDILAFIFDTILARIVAHRLPDEIHDRLSDYLAGTSWKLLDLGYWGGLANLVAHNIPNRQARWDALQDSILTSGGYQD